MNLLEKIMKTRGKNQKIKETLLSYLGLKTKNNACLMKK